MVNPRSLVAWALISLIAENEPPTCSSFTSFMFCAQIVGKPVTAPEPTAAPAAAAAACSKVLRESSGPSSVTTPSYDIPRSSPLQRISLCEGHNLTVADDDQAITHVMSVFSR